MNVRRDARAAVDSMVRALEHRGPDGRGAAAGERWAFGHTRLSIIDLGGGAQPMSDVSGRYSITFNGELYNYRELRKELRSLGTAFHTDSDTEVVLAAYVSWGESALDRFRGMFALAIWDAAERTLFAARDLFGEKPLFYAETGEGGLLLASEIKALMATGLVAGDLDRAAVDAYLAFGYVPPTMTIRRAVRPLPPAHWLRWTAGRIVIQRYWTPRFDTRSIALEDAADTLRALLRQSVQRQMVADVPVGAFLSGGLDSTSIVALMSDVTTTPVRTFSAAFGDEINELPYARLVAERYRTDHHEIDLGTPPVAELLQTLARVYDEPFADTSALPTFMISGFARQHVKVVLSGDGGDEMVGGYGWYQLLAASEHVRGTRAEWVILRVLSRVLRDRVRRLYRRSVAVGLSARWPDMWLRAAMNQVYLSQAQRARLWASRNGSGFDERTGDAADASVRGLDRAFYFDLTTYLPGDILVKVDRASMAHGLETRAPFLDRDLAEFALTLPAALKVDEAETKIVLRRACQEMWPDEIRRRGKHGFGAPYRRWLARADVASLADRVFRRGGPLRELLPGIPASPAPASYTTWTLLTLGVWLESRAL